MKKWLVIRETGDCSIENDYGLFGLRAYELQDPYEQPRTVLTIYLGPPHDDMLLRINSGCITGELLEDRACDCKWQFVRSLQMIANEKSGMIIYAPYEEGRGVGLFDKVRTMSVIQTQKVPSSQAFKALGLPVDTRDFGYAPAILHRLKVRRLRCLTNNPSKICCLREHGFEITERLSLVVENRPDLEDLMRDKRDQLGHDI